MEVRFNYLLDFSSSIQKSLANEGKLVNITVVISWDPYPQTDVSNWDGLQDLSGDVHNMPFYHIIPDLSDTVKAFGQERRFRYVCQENLEWCPENHLDVEVILDEGWSASDGRNEFIAPDILRFSHFEKIQEEEIIDACFNDLQVSYSIYILRLLHPVHSNA